eukprot:Plantae.Rhodophyta-Hildenbrandia_rubra.ctg8948.p1 GENE.Plantae.Rhodophyta-Hildenbrandia_rubra.ctg8948~~Plantae.Rhodophyta-Hildenbrandia_rubra.ctg8948.p1  ORF type:complete len:653 (-),score=60.97 Plantae.Rhodophyta-Hildenbrandia_rubra.ctg8948:113-2071(-)
MNSIIARYLSVPGVFDWLMSRKPVRDVTLAALDNSFVYSIGLGMTKPIQFRAAGEAMDPPDGNEIEDLLIVTDMCGDFVLGAVFGLSFEHIFARTPLMQDVKVVCRRFAVDLSRKSELEFVEFVWFEDGKLITMDRSFFHTETGELPTRAEAILYDVIPPGSLPENVLMRASLLELPDCRICAAQRRPCDCPLPLSVVNGDAGFKLQEDSSRKVVTTCWGHYAASFMSKARNGRVSLKYFQNFRGLGEVQLEHRSLPIVNVLVNGQNHYIKMARRRAIHHLGLRITPRFETRFTMPSMASDFQNLHDAYTSGLRELDSNGMTLPLPGNTTGAVGTTVLPSPLVKTDIFDPVYIEELLDSVSSGDNTTHQHTIATDTTDSLNLGTSSESQALPPPSQGILDDGLDDGEADQVYDTFIPGQEQQRPLQNAAVGSVIDEILQDPVASDTSLSVGNTILNQEILQANSDNRYLNGVAKRSKTAGKASRSHGRRENTSQDSRITLQPRFFCDQCSSSFKSKGDMRRHKLTIHDKIKPFICEKCHASFGHRGHLNRHVKTVHLRERPYRCNTCGFRFLQASHLEMHQKMVHEKLKPFLCDICKLSVTTRSALRNHLRHVHHVSDAYRCPVESCLEGFILKFDLTRHMSKVHQIEYEAD